ncbi:hypothetical protein BSLG_005967 [Batrachochytrium salamandrivorans]|nr:hypothetical protein BSLG_005967 [Batrachochytrium salamandrivorans]
MNIFQDQYKWCASQRSSTPDNQPDITVYFVPRRTLICDQILEEQGIFGDIAIGDYHLDIVPLEEDLLSLELTRLNHFMCTCHHEIPNSFMAPFLEFLERVLTELLIRMRRDYSIADAPLNSSQASDSEFDSIIILDRTVDLVSPLRVQLTYEGLIDELFSIKTRATQIENYNSAQGFCLKIGDNGIYDDILRYAGNPDTVKRWAAEEVFTHGKSSSSDLEYIEELIGRQAPIETVLRLLCLYCVVNGGLKTKYYDSFRRHIVQADPDGMSDSKQYKSATDFTIDSCCFSGGCTMAEVAALRFISGGDSSQRGFIILTTGITTGSRLLNSMVSKPNATGSCTPAFSTLKNTTD